MCLSTDYKHPVRIGFGINARILTAEVSEVSPDNLQASVSIEDAWLVLAPILLNSGDSITVKTLVSQFDKQVNIDGRIVGVKTIKEATEGRAQYFILALGSVGLTTIGTSLWLRSLPLPPEQIPFPQRLPYLLLILLGYALMLIRMFRYSRIWRVVRRLFISSEQS